MSAARSDAATSTDDIVKGPLCLFYFTHPFGVLSCEPPTVLAPAPPAPAPAPAPPAPTAMARRSPTWPAGACTRRLPPYSRTLPPLKLPTPKDSSSLDGSDDVWSRSSFVPPDKMSLPPIELPPTPPPACEARAVRARRLGPVGVRKAAVRSRGAALARLLRRAVATGGAGVERSPRGVLNALGTVRAAWQPARAAGSDAGAGSRSPPRTSWESNSSTIGIGGEEDSVDGGGGDCGGGSGSVEGGGYGGGAGYGDSVSGECSDMGPRAPSSPASSGLLHRRYSVPEIVMRRYRLARELSEVEDEALPLPALTCAPRELVRRSALLRRMGGAQALSPCRCDTRSLDGSRAEVCQPLMRAIRSPEYALEPTPVNHSLPTPASNDNNFDPILAADVLEIVVSETSPAVLSRPSRMQPTRSSDCNLNIDEYVSNILVDSLNSLTDRLESMTVSIGGGDGRISVVEKEIKVKLQNKGVNTVVHLSPTSNNQIIFGNRELCERDALHVPLASEERLFSEEYQVSAESWHVPPRTASPCASLVDSLDDPMSPRAAPPPPPPPLPPPPPPLQASPQPPPLDICESSHLTPLSSAYTDMEYSPSREKCESFFIRMNEDNCACEKENIIVADHMPEKIKQRLYRRHRRREMRAQGARRGAARRNAQRDVQRQCAALVDALIDDAIAKVAREEHRYARIARQRELPSPNENALRPRMWNGRSNSIKSTTKPRIREDNNNMKNSSLTAQAPIPAPTTTRERVPPRRLYHKSEIHDGGKCIEILEIVEYANTPRSSSETNSDESLNTAKNRRSRIPVPIQDKAEQPRVRRASVALAASTTTANTVSTTTRRASVPGAELCAPSSSMRFERVFDVIPEERSSLSLESASEDMRAPPSAPPSRRSAATSPQAPPGSTSGSVERVPSRKDRGRDRRSIGTQWTRTPLQPTQNSSGHNSDVESELPEEEEHSSSCECESVCEVPPPQPVQQSARRRVRVGQRVRRRALRPAPPPPPPVQPHRADAAPDSSAAPATAAAHNMPASNAAAGTSGAGDGWSLTLAGSCRAALPSRLDLRLRFPSRSGAAANPAPSSRSDAATDRYSDAGSQDREWTACKRPSVTRGTHAAPAIRYNSTGDSLATVGRGRALRRRRKSEDDSRDSGSAVGHPPPRAAPDVLPALGAPPLRRADFQARGAPCHCWAASPAPTPAPTPAPVPRRARAPPAAPPRSRRARAPSPPSPDVRPHPDRLQRATLLNTQYCGELKAAGTALAVLGCAIVPERRAAPPTASQRDVHRTRRAARAAHPPPPRAPAPRRHSVATTAALDSNMHCLCYTYT